MVLGLEVVAVVLPEPEEPVDVATVTGSCGSVDTTVVAPVVGPERLEVTESPEEATVEPVVDELVELTDAWVVDELSTAVDVVVDVDVEDVEVAAASSAELPESPEPPPQPLTRIPVAMASAETPRPLRKLNAIETT